MRSLNARYMLNQNRHTNQCCEGEIVEQISEDLPHICITISVKPKTMITYREGMKRSGNYDVNRQQNTSADGKRKLI